jgi:hypothetical protein
VIEETHMADHPPDTGTPRWVKIFGIIAAVVILLFVVFMLTGGPGGHGPSRHTGGLGDYTASFGVTEQAAHRP